MCTPLQAGRTQQSDACVTPATDSLHRRGTTSLRYSLCCCSVASLGQTGSTKIPCIISDTRVKGTMSKYRQQCSYSNGRGEQECHLHYSHGSRDTSCTKREEQDQPLLHYSRLLPLNLSHPNHTWRHIHLIAMTIGKNLVHYLCISLHVLTHTLL